MRVIFIRDLPSSDRCQQKLWKADDGNYYVSSIARLPDILYGTNEYETMVFASDLHGVITSYTDLGCVKFADHEWALRAAELDWDIIDVESIVISGELGKGE